MLSRALDLWSATRMVEKMWRITGEDTLGMNVVSDPEAPHFDIIPVTPIMDTQLDQIVIQYILEPLRQSILDELDTKVRQHKPKDFFETYLTFFILLCSIERNTIAQMAFAKRYRVGRKFSNPRLLESYFHAARILLSRFHFVCQGPAAIESDWTRPEVASFANLDKQQVKFMEETKALIAKQGNTLSLLQEKKEYERPLYWCHQLFFPNWYHGGPIHIPDEITSPVSERGDTKVNLTDSHLKTSNTVKCW